MSKAVTHDPNLLIVVPARGGSKRLPGKNIRLLDGIPLIGHTARFLEGEGLLDCALMSTDSAEIAGVARECGFAVPFMRPAELATDDATTLAVVLHALEHQREKTGVEPRIVVVLQPTSPFRRRGLLREALDVLSRDASAASVIAMSLLHVTANFVFVQDTDGSAIAVSNSSKPAMVPSGSLYSARTSAIQSQHSLYAGPMVPIHVSAWENVDIDTEVDFLLAETMIQSGVIPHPMPYAGTPGNYVGRSVLGIGDQGHGQAQSRSVVTSDKRL